MWVRVGARWVDVTFTHRGAPRALQWVLTPVTATRRKADAMGIVAALFGAWLAVAPSDEASIVMVEPSDPGLTPAVSAIEEHMQAAGVEFELAASFAPGAALDSQLETARGLGEEHDVTAIAWVIRETGGTTRILLLVPATERVYTRTLEPTGTGQADLETLGLVLASSARALAEQADESPPGFEAAVVETTPPDAAPPTEAEVPVERAPVETARTAEPPPPEPPPKLRVELHAGYAGASFGNALAWQHGVQGGLGLVFSERGAVGLEYAFGAPAQVPVSGQPAATWSMHGLGISGAFIQPLGERLGLRLRAGPLLGWARWRGSDADSRRVLVSIDASLRLSVEIVGGLGAYLEGGAVAALNNFDYVLECAPGSVDCTPGDTQTVFVPWPVRPKAAAGARYRF